MHPSSPQSFSVNAVGDDACLVVDREGGQLFGRKHSRKWSLDLPPKMTKSGIDPVDCVYEVRRLYR